MWLGELTLVNFRNFRRLALELPPGLAVVCGSNGQGKTNLLEAVHVLATTRSPRTSAERELVTWQAPGDEELAGLVAPFARLEGRVQRQAGEVHLEVLFKGGLPGPDGSPGAFGEPHPSSGVTAGEVTGSLARGIKVNGLPTRAAGLIGQLPVVYFSPGDVALAGGPPAGRRQYLNVANSQTAPFYLRALQRYNRVLLQRNQLLRQLRERRQPPAALEPWTEQLIQVGAIVLRQRLAMLAAVNDRLRPIFRDLAGTTEELRVIYRSTACGAPLPAREPPDAAALARGYRDRLEQLAGREVEQAVSLVGPHRDDFAFMLGGVDVNTYGSRGEQRLAVLALKLAEADWMHAEVGDRPVLLLDDLLSELDPRKRGYVLERVARGLATGAGQPTPGAGQVLITTTDLSSFPAPFLGAARRFEIDAGRVRAA